MTEAEFKSNLPSAPNEVQWLAISNLDNNLLILAGPGSGKTRVLTYKMAYLIGVQKINPSLLLAMAFTNKAADEMRARIELLVGKKGERCWINTFHSFAAIFLRMEAENAGLSKDFVIFDESDKQSLLKKCMKFRNINTKELDIKKVVQSISYWKMNLIPPKDAPVDADPRSFILRELYNDYQEDKKRHNALDFDDLLIYTYSILKNKQPIQEKWRQRFKYVMIDEFQDTNFIQYQIAKYLVGEDTRFCAVGDDDQSIYKWRGANLANILHYVENDFPDLSVLTLGQNYRSTKRILKAASSVVGKNRMRKKKNLWTDNEDGDPIKIIRALDEDEEAEIVTRLIVEHREKGIPLKEIAVFYRANWQSRAFEDTLSQYEIPYKVIGGVKFYQRKEIKEIIAYLRLVLNPKDDVSFERVINIPSRGIGEKTLTSLRNFAIKNNCSLLEATAKIKEFPDIKQKTQALIEFGDMITKLSEMCKTMKASEFVKYVIVNSGYEKYLDDLGIEGVARKENLGELITILKHIEDESELIESQQNTNSALHIFLAKAALVSDSDNLDDKSDTVTLITVHSAKGLEYTVVFLTGLEMGIFPHHLSLDSEEELEEERRLCYVAMTRAKKHLYALHTWSRTCFGREMKTVPSIFLKDIPQDCCEATIPRPYISRNLQVQPQKPSDKRLPIAYSIDDDLAQEEFFIGDRISHRTFGKGKIVAKSGKGNNAKLTVVFDLIGGEKTLQQGIAKLRRI